MELEQPWHQHHHTYRSPPRRPHSPIYDALVTAGSRLRPLQQVHSRMVVSGLHHNRSLITKLITLAAAAAAATSSNSVHYTRCLLYTAPNPDAFLFNTLIRVSSKSTGLSADAIHFYSLMRFEGIPQSSYSFTPVFKACADLMSLEIGKMVHCHVLLDGFDSDCFIQTGLIGFYTKCGHVEVARMVFDRMSLKSIVAWNSMISGYEQNGFAEEAVEVFVRMREAGIALDSATLVSLLSACSQLGQLDLGQWVRDYIVEKGLELNVVLGTSLINMYSRCSNVDKAREVFDELRERNVVAWTAMISGYGMHGFGDRAVELFHQMRSNGPTPNHVTFIAMLSACAHAGLVEEGRKAFECMKRDYGLVPRLEHNVCMVDLLGRAGLLDEAMQFIRESVPGEPGPAIWTAMLGACKMYRNFKLGVEVAERLLAAEPENPGHYVLLSNIYALAGKMDRVETVRNSMIYRRLKKQIGFSLIEIDHTSHMFRMGDRSHPQTAEIYKFLAELIRRSRENGYEPSTESVLHQLEEEEREFALRFHSEKLAIAFGIMSTEDGSVIRVVKNLRMCEDCHLATKFFSIVAGREIIVRDKLRFHHFNGGSCSCQDYW